MPKYYRCDLRGQQQLPRAPAGPLLGRQIARRQPIVSAMRAQDLLVATSRRVVLQVGKSGATAWSVPSTDPNSASQTHPLANVARTVARSKFTKTPGCMLTLRAVVSLSGQTQRQTMEGVPPAPYWRPNGAQGRIRVTSTWDDGGTPVQRVHEVNLPVAGGLFAAAPTSDGGAFASMRTVRIPLIAPEAMNSVVRERRWSQPTVVDLEVAYVGGARVHHCTISEVPHVLAYEADDTGWVGHCFGSTPTGPGPFVDYPYERLSEVTPDGDPRGGSRHAAEVANNQAERLGPILVNWGAYSEDTADVTDTHFPPVTTTSATFVGLTNASLTGYSAANEGWSMSPGSYARTRQFNDPSGMPNSGVIPIMVRAYCDGSNGGGVLRFQTDDDEWVDVTVPNGSPAGWYRGRGFASVGCGPGDPAVAQAFIRRASGTSFAVYSLTVEHHGANTRAVDA